MSRLVTERVSRAEAEQRRGRAGRVAPGVCYRLWARAEEGALPAFAPPEMLTADLAGLALELAIWGSDGSQFNAIRQDFDWVTFLDSDRTQRPYVRLQGTAVFRWAAFEMGKVAQRALEAAKIGSEDLDVFVPHQANTRINDLLAKTLHLPEGTPVANDIEHTGNTSAASIPLAMEDLLSTGKAKPGDTALLLGYGAGLSYAAQVVKMPPVPFE